MPAGGRCLAWRAARGAQAYQRRYGDAGLQSNFVVPIISFSRYRKPFVTNMVMLSDPADCAREPPPAAPAPPDARRDTCHCSPHRLLRLDADARGSCC